MIWLKFNRILFHNKYVKCKLGNLTFYLLNIHKYPERNFIGELEMKERCSFCKKTLGSCTCEENLLGDYHNKTKDRDDPFGWFNLSHYNLTEACNHT